MDRTTFCLSLPIPARPFFAALRPGPSQSEMRSVWRSGQRFLSSTKPTSLPATLSATSSASTAKQTRGQVPPGIWQRVSAQLHLKRGHPLCTLREKIQDYFQQREPDHFKFYNDLSPVVSIAECFDSLLVPANHVSRAASDTYYIDETTLLRAHMTAHDVGLLRSGVRAFINCGDVYRRDTVDRTHHPVFHQVDGARLFEAGTPQATVIADLKDALGGLARELFGVDTRTRWVESTFPFTNPSFELEVHWGGEWLEVLGCGELRRGVLDNAGVDGQTTGWAFGLGLERLAMVLFGVPDIRLFWSEDPRFSAQFRDGDLSTRFKPFSVYPPVAKDVSFWVEDKERFHENDVHECARLVAGELVEDVRIVDRFVKEERESLCFRVTFRSMERSLTHAEVNRLYFELREDLESKLPVELR